MRFGHDHAALANHRPILVGSRTLKGSTDRPPGRAPGHVPVRTACGMWRPGMGEVGPDITSHGDPPERETAPRLVVGLGASAGGIKALQEFFTRVPPDSGVA